MIGLKLCVVTILMKVRFWRDIRKLDQNERSGVAHAEVGESVQNMNTKCSTDSSRIRTGAVIAVDVT